MQQAVIHRVAGGAPIGTSSAGGAGGGEPSVLERFVLQRCSASMHFALRCHLLLRAVLHEPGSNHVNNDEDESLDVILLFFFFFRVVFVLFNFISRSTY